MKKKLYEAIITPETTFLRFAVEAHSEEAAQVLIEDEISELDGATCDVSGTKFSVTFHDMKVINIIDFGEV